jgi:SEC-C motif
MPPLPREKTGRNDPCPCRSGKKYKHCCLKVARASDDSPWGQQRDASGRLAQEMLHFARRRFADDVLAAWLDFNQDETPLSLEEDVAEGQIFLPYFLFDWDPAPRSRRRSGQPEMGLVARSYLSTSGSRLPELEGLILEQATTQPLSFYEVVRCDPGERMVLRDVLIGGETEVIERTASQMMQSGDLGYGQMCRLPEVTTLGRWAPVCIPPGKKGAIVGLRGKLRKKIAKQNRELTAADLIRYREEIRTAYLDIRDAMRMPPRLTNTDGDPLVLHTLTFRTGSAHAAFEALAPLAWGVSKKELLQGAKLDADGTLRSAEIPWLKKGNRMHKDWETTILGHLRISGRSLVVDVNSDKRAGRIREEIEKRLGILATHQKKVTQRPEAALEKAKRRRTPPGSASEVESAGLSAEPELDQQMREEIQRHFENWIFQKVPALGGLTPLEAVGDPDGREIVESLLLDWERHNEKMADPGVFYPDINAIRRLLQLTPSVP